MSELVARPDPILVGLSGGVDSAVAVRILQEQGFAVHGLVISFSLAHAPAVEAARRAAQELEIPLTVRHCEPRFEEMVIAPFCSAYQSGRTPNPCILCNPSVKFYEMAAAADELGIHFLATGHYARVEEQDGLYHVAKATSTARDQSYMLYRLPQDILRRLALPLGEFDKDDIREMAREYGLSSASAPDSQEICFIPDGDYAAYIRARGGEGLQGSFISPEGENLGPHKGALHYTVGQRRGLGIALGKPVFVKAIAPNGDVLLGYGGEEFSAAISLEDIVTVNGKPLAEGDTYDVKIRSMAKPVPCRVFYHNEAAALRFDQPQRAPAPGQSAVLYKGELVMGGGIISQTFD